MAIITERDFLWGWIAYDPDIYDGAFDSDANYVGLGKTEGLAIDDYEEWLLTEYKGGDSNPSLPNGSQ